MIDFACKKFKLDDVIKCSLTLTKSDFRILEFLIKKNRDKIDFTSSELAKISELDISTIQRSLKKLFGKNLIIRSQKNLSKGGYVFSYKINDKKIIRKVIRDIIDNWVKKVDIELERW